MAPQKIEIFNVHEYGKNGKKHWHLIVFNHDFPDKTVHSMSAGIPLYTSEQLRDIWPHGFNTIGDVSAASAMYQAQYCEKDFKNGNVTNGKKSHSRHSGIGRPYFMRHYEQILSLGFIPFNGSKLPVPRYFQKLAHKHYCYFYEPTAFRDLTDRKALYRPFKKEIPNIRIANLFIQFRDLKQEKILDLEREWSELISEHLTSRESPDFIKSASNALYDLNNNNQQERF